MQHWDEDYINISMEDAHRGVHRYTGISHEWSISCYLKRDNRYVLGISADDLVGHNRLKEHFGRADYAVEFQSRMGFDFTLSNQDELNTVFSKLKQIIPFFSEVETPLMRASRFTLGRINLREENLETYQSSGFSYK